MTIIILCVLHPSSEGLNNADDRSEAVIYGGVGHHIQELHEDNLVAFFKVRLYIGFHKSIVTEPSSSSLLYNSPLGRLLALQRYRYASSSSGYSSCAHFASWVS